MALYRDGAQWWLDADELQAARVEQEERYAEDVWADDIAAFVADKDEVISRRYPGAAWRDGRAPRPGGNEPHRRLPEGAGLLEASAHVNAAAQVGLPQSGTVGRLAPLFLPLSY